jgi:hypothetical protein
MPEQRREFVENDMAKTQPFSKDVAQMSKSKSVGFEEDERGSVNPQKPQHPENRHGARYDNDTKEGWLHGVGDRPGFDYRGKDGYPKKWNNT